MNDETLYSKENITHIEANEIFVFGSNLQGCHGSGAARMALSKFGAIWGKGVGSQGQSYAIPTMEGDIDTIKPYVDEFIDFAEQHPDYQFLLTRIGSGITGFTDEDIVPLFAEALKLHNVKFPKIFIDVLVHLR